jgi:hypothetical protein
MGDTLNNHREDVLSEARCYCGSDYQGTLYSGDQLTVMLRFCPVIRHPFF